ncbi:MAG: hypothetical protein AB7U45_04465 [Desulfamplus sp.]
MSKIITICLDSFLLFDKDLKTKKTVDGMKIVYAAVKRFSPSIKIIRLIIVQTKR